MEVLNTFRELADQEEYSIEMDENILQEKRESEQTRIFEQDEIILELEQKFKEQEINMAKLELKLKEQTELASKPRKVRKNQKGLAYNFSTSSFNSEKSKQKINQSLSSLKSPNQYLSNRRFSQNRLYTSTLSTGPQAKRKSKKRMKSPTVSKSYKYKSEVIVNSSQQAKSKRVRSPSSVELRKKTKTKINKISDEDKVA